MRRDFSVWGWAALSLALVAEPASAQYLKDTVAKACAGYTYASSADRLTSCSSIIDGADWTDKGRAWAYAYRAGAYYELRKLDLALSDANKAIELWPERLPGYVIRATTLTDLGRVDEALVDLDKVVEADGGYAAYLARGHAYYQKRDYDLAIADFTMAIDKMPNSPAALMGRGNSYNALKRYADASKDFSTAIVYAPQEPRLWSGRAAASDGLGQRDAALADLRRALGARKALEKTQAAPAATWSQLSAALAKHGDYASAVVADDQAVAKSPVADTYNERCWHRAVANLDLAAARSDCDRAVELAPGDAEILDSRAFVRFRSGELAGAILDADAALKLAPKQASSLYIRSLAEAAMGRAEQAKSDLDAAKAVQPDIADEYAAYGVKP